ncbi:MAG: diacylglycerol kinase family protein [Verrucomicrobiota bacterium]
MLTESTTLLPDQKRICIIANPAARSERARKFLDTIQALTDRHTVMRLTEGPGDAEAQAERAVEQGYGMVIAAGGDGTVNEVVNGIAGSGVTLGLLPIGTMNVFATELGIPMDLEKAWAVANGDNYRMIDLAAANDHFFVQLAGVGLDAQIVAGTSPEQKRALGPLSYLLTATQIAGQKPPRLTIEADDRQINGSFVLVGNGRFYGGPFMLFTEADLSDGKLDVCVFKYMNYLHLVRYFRGVLFGSHTKFSDVTYFKTKKLRVSAAHPHNVPVEVDGELSGHLPVEFRVRKRKLRVRVP